MAKRVTFAVMSDSPFTVWFTDNVSLRTKLVKYEVALTTSELEREAESIIFDEEPKVKKSAASRSPRRNTGIIGLNIDLQLIHLQNLSIERDKIAQYLKDETEPTCVTEMLQNQLNFLNWIVQEDFPSPIAKDLWNYDPTERLSAAKY